MNPHYADSPIARRASGSGVALRVDINRIDHILQSSGGDLTDWGFELYTIGQGCNGNLPPLYARRSDGMEWEFDGCFHCWVPVFEPAIKGRG